MTFMIYRVIAIRDRMKHLLPGPQKKDNDFIVKYGG